MSLINLLLLLALLLTVCWAVPSKYDRYCGGAALLLVIIVELMEHWK